MATAALGYDRPPGEAQGTALDGGMHSQGEADYPYAQPGDEYWVALPAPANTSGTPLTVLDATIAPAPRGVRILGYRAVSAEYAGGYLLGFAHVGAEDSVLERAHDYAGDPIPVEPHQRSDVYYLARLRVTGPIHGKLTTCRFRYRQGSNVYRQDLRCLNELKIGTEPESTS
ncbi:hypothetical protein [Streptomyces sp. NPDC001068]|uniref:hypothetical protein n=1 Tax=Streptomyces sp. NPDC001068 TaxID=3364544 RepID=UPI003675AC20